MKAPRKFFDDQFRNINMYVNGITGMHTAAWASLRGFGWVSWMHYRKKNAIIDLIYEVVY